MIYVEMQAVKNYLLYVADAVKALSTRKHYSSFDAFVGVNSY